MPLTSVLLSFKEVFLCRELPLFRGLLRLHHGSESGRDRASLFYVKDILSKLFRPLSKAPLVPVYRKIHIHSASVGTPFSSMVTFGSPDRQRKQIEASRRKFRP